MLIRPLIEFLTVKEQLTISSILADVLFRIITGCTDRNNTPAQTTVS